MELGVERYGKGGNLEVQLPAKKKERGAWGNTRKHDSGKSGGWPRESLRFKERGEEGKKNFLVEDHARNEKPYYSGPLHA